MNELKINGKHPKYPGLTPYFFTFGHFQNLKIDRALILEAENCSKNFHLFVFRLNTLLEETLHEE